MTELKKVARVIAKRLPDAPHETLLVLDGTIGQNAVQQAKMFSAAVPELAESPQSSRTLLEGLITLPSPKVIWK